MPSLITYPSLAERLASLRKSSQVAREPIPLRTILTIYLNSNWATMEAADWQGFKNLVKTFGPVKLPSYPNQNFPFVFANWSMSKIAEIVKSDIHTVGLTFLYIKYPMLEKEEAKRSLVIYEPGGVDKQARP